MFYLSTRGYSSNELSFSKILINNLAPDGGLYVPIHYPKISHLELNQWRGLSYPKLAYEILCKFTPDIPSIILQQLINKIYTKKIYQNARADEDTSDITPLRLLETINGTKLILQGLSNGPTLAFKDIAMQLLGNLLEYIAHENKSVINIIGATSGDTGSAAEYAMRNKKRIRIFMLSPLNKISDFQRAQMFSLQDTNIYNLAVPGVFDDCQNIVKAILHDPEFKKNKKISTVNSINWARIMIQIVYYFYGYLNTTTHNDQKVSFTVPSGNFGNICAGHISRMMGLPIDKLIIATNENDVLHEFFSTGIYRIRTSQEIYHTSSPSMDISKASNLERFIYDLLNRNSIRTTKLFQKIEKTGNFDLTGQRNSDGDEFKNIKHYGLLSGKSTHIDRLNMIQFASKQYNIIIDPHTANGLKVALENLSPGTNMIVLETALAAKFNNTIREALGRDAERPNKFQGIENLPQRFYSVVPNINEVKDFLNRNLL